MFDTIDNVICSLYTLTNLCTAPSQVSLLRSPAPFLQPGQGFHRVSRLPPLHPPRPNGILILYPSSPGSSVHLPSGASCRNGYTTATFGIGPGMRPMQGLRVA